MTVIAFIVVLIYGRQLFDFFKEKDLKKYCDVLGKDEKKLLKKRQIEMLLLLMLLFFIPSDKQKYFVILIIFVYKNTYFNLKREFLKLKKSLNLQFAIWLRMMEVLLSYHTVPLAIEVSIASAPELMKKSLQKLVKDLKKDPLNRDTYLNFMSTYEELNIERSMHHLYRYAVMGSEDASIQLSNMVEDNAESLLKAREDMFESRLNFYSWYGLVPMLLVSMSFLGLMFMVLSNLMKGGWHV